ncbi:HAD family hydrolase [Cytobacillus purgationiresistens]|uniref:Hydroxymethylpyrimidine pyrophosphatase-like HAD family hydrolase n=1 Tax=Cytobacillus purgationiresistens TaxID=863449 RepID=A0ABU0AMN6_9BACI|nr:hypothetical protein [Cytobacillus purgationiresistens]MDQ0272016.1 hydroxymethylpyrimidine pyrophosphatase-like HAD family hydrolase [Cytobacillus purgationiresistens]
MMLFASDLDRTLIYSKRALAEFQEEGRLDILPVEFQNGEEMAYITKSSLETLHNIAKEVLFVPVTTRTPEQYNRIDLQLPITYAITSNGANICYKGKILNEWHQLVLRRLSDECLDIEALMKDIHQFSIDGIRKVADGLFFYYILADPLPANTVHELSQFAFSEGWRISLQGRKIYFMPNPISKGKAVNFIKERENISISYGAGDSLLDDDFLQECDHSFVPIHGELASLIQSGRIYEFTAEKGMQATEELLQSIEEKLHSYREIYESASSLLKRQ